jgi:hypothetical protein
VRTCLTDKLKMRTGTDVDVAFTSLSKSGGHKEGNAPRQPRFKSHNQNPRSLVPTEHESYELLWPTDQRNT